MSLSLGKITYLVRDYDEAIAWFRDRLDFNVTEDTDLGGGKRWVTLAVDGGVALLLAKASNEQQQAAIGKAAGGRVAFFLYTESFAETFARFKKRGVRFREEPRAETYGTVAVFEDLYGNTWDLIETKKPGQ